MSKFLHKLLVFCIAVLLKASATETSLEFPTEFFATYDIAKRDTHEYNPYILRKTRKSFLELENVLEEAGFTLARRWCVFGYQEEAVPPYTTNWQRVAIEDETIVKTHAGISTPTKNIFGFMTGFLLKDAEWLQKEWFAHTQTQVMHICARPVALFADSALVFQKHAFGSQFDYMVSVRDTIERALYKKDIKAVLGELINFWSHLEREAAKTGSQETVATQDMLFSIDYARALIEGKTAIEKIYIGPDITYPIEVLSCQKTHATLHAQEFVQKIQELLQPVNNSNTAYIFCSFVDGVGKSTLLNNIQNWHEFRDQFDKYKRCDNSSSQEAQVFNFKEQVFIVDLPAQMSHFVIKPDGFVFSDIETVKAITPEILQEIIAHINQERDLLVDQFRALKKKYRELSESALYASADHIEQYAHNCVILGAEEYWIPCRYKSHELLFNQETGKLRVLVSFADAHSLGLKVVEPEQMLFSKGLSLPMDYKVFMADLVAKLKKADIKQICFVDFLSMYPRSSRETIRLNFVLQYVKKIFKELYKFEYTSYKHHVYKEQELCHLLNKNGDKAAEMLTLEGSVRWGLDCLLEKAPTETIHYLAREALEAQLKDTAQRLIAQHKNALTKLAVDRLEPIREIYENAYNFDRIYETLVKFSSEPLVKLSSVMHKLFTVQFKNDYLQQLWADFPETLTTDLSNITELPYNFALNGQDFSVRSRMHRDCRDEEMLKDFIRPLRAQWYAMLTHLLYTHLTTDNEYAIKQIKHISPSLMLYEHADGYLYTIQKALPELDVQDLENIKLRSHTLFNLADTNLRKRTFGEFHEIPHCLNWYNKNTYTGLFGYNYINQAKNTNILSRIIDIYHEFFVKYGRPEYRATAAEFVKQFTTPVITKIRKSELMGKKLEALDAHDSRLPGIRLWVRAVATLDMILKDPETKILVRKGNKQDFAAALQLLEYYTLPHCFGIVCKSPLFTDYEAVEPVISWDIINQY